MSVIGSSSEISADDALCKKLLAKNPDIEKVLLDTRQVKKRVKELAKAINEKYEGKRLVVVGILKGAFMFMSDLCKHLTVEHQVDFMALSSYGKNSVRGAVRIIMDCRVDLGGRDVLIVEDIVDSGYTLQFLQNLLKTRQPASLATAVFLRKKECIQVDSPLDFIGFDVPNDWLVGFGLDYGERLRTLPFVGVLKKSVYEKDS
mmetsp:Transcript_15138/g.22680  ORF Transcript_15138/g.22680 Transcript_15138/m.22680 type:complete len:203 (+) Transcript_15138:43-651(+)|eukprot:CAMPEP_0201547218 /NCGR_PEP_ID=MMETSP0173_2-20130828/3656_1 /ASSEMBLY_ACC=CAM_ASM_000268 /TAXON_ID=218659 /ORGANISM="Vexillifera sp., Strain DIVA3 564/2" /LENGTH=202 /DNA_ID=CAMNT_0047956187 /DNA_START=42 /DNA_END=650 /DNA_ORIENTATION=-